MNSNNIFHSKSKLGLEITAVIACKLIFIFGLWYFYFSPAHRPDVTADVVSNVVLSTTEAPVQANPTK